MKKQTFLTPYTYQHKATNVTGITLTVPDLALTNTEHIKKARLGIADQTVKMIYDPEDIFPDLRACDLIDQREMLLSAREQVQLLMKKRDEAIAQSNEKKKMEEQARTKEIDDRLKKMFDDHLKKTIEK